jgi:hypothetical protein
MIGESMHAVTCCRAIRYLLSHVVDYQISETATKREFAESGRRWPGVAGLGTGTDARGDGVEYHELSSTIVSPP